MPLGVQDFYSRINQCNGICPVLLERPGYLKYATMPITVCLFTVTIILDFSTSKQWVIYSANFSIKRNKKVPRYRDFTFFNKEDLGVSCRSKCRRTLI